MKNWRNKKVANIFFVVGRCDQCDINWEDDEGDPRYQNRVGQNRPVRPILDHHLPFSSPALSNRWRYRTAAMVTTNTNSTVGLEPGA